MTSDFQRTLESKRAQRKRLASRPIGEKLHVLDVLREREVAIRRRTEPFDAQSRTKRDAVAGHRVDRE
ncbi:MAG: hypothetical protein JWM95_3951 [Gemmatimonadetes bacterium]|nr:hypothetical protein [Gemmatimonadota bacterium]